jgi:hypothetical protein
MRTDTRAVVLLLGCLALLGWTWALWLLVRPTPVSYLAPASAERWLVAYTATSGAPLQIDRRFVSALGLPHLRVNSEGSPGNLLGAPGNRARTATTQQAASDDDGLDPQETGQIARQHIRQVVYAEV